MKVLLDTTVINWLTDNPGAAQEFLAGRDGGVFKAFVTTLSRFFPLTPTRVPRVGAARSGLARASTPTDAARLEDLGLLRDGQDRNLAANAAGYDCHVFLTRDYEMSRDKRQALEASLGGVRVLEPEEFIRSLRDASKVGEVP